MNKSEIEQLRGLVIERVDMSREPDDSELHEIIDSVIEKNQDYRYMSIKKRQIIHKKIYSSIRGLGIIEELLEEPDITEIMINGPNNIFVEKKGRINKIDERFESENRLNDIIQQIVAKTNRRVNESNPIVDTRLEDGSRVNVILPPIALEGPIVTIRKFSKRGITIDDMISWGTISKEAADFLKMAVMAGYNIFVSGGTGSGKTTFLNVLSNFIPKDERIVTIEDSAELKLDSVDNIVRMETRQANSQGENVISIRDLIKASLRVRPDRIIVGEVRGGETLDMLQAMNTGHDGSMSTGHGNSPSDMMTRLETMVLMGIDMPLAAIRAQIATAIDIVIHLGRMRDKTRKVLEINEVVGIRNGQIELNRLYVFKEEPESDKNKVVGQLERTENPLINKQKLERKGLAYDNCPVRGNMNYCMSGKKKTVSLIIIGLLVILMGRMFYGSFKAGIIILPLVIPIYRQYSTKYKDRAKAEFEHQYKEMLVALKDGIVTGYSVENGLKESYREMVNIYGYDGLICSELRLMTSRLKFNTPIEMVFKDFAERTDLESAHMFYNTFSIAQKSGGNMNNVIKRVIENIVLKESVKEEINVAINDKKLEQRIMTVIPLLLIGYISMASPGFLDIMYKSIMGNIVMTVCLIVYLLAYLWSEKIVKVSI